MTDSRDLALDLSIPAYGLQSRRRTLNSGAGCQGPRVMDFAIRLALLHGVTRQDRVQLHIDIVNVRRFETRRGDRFQQYTQLLRHRLSIWARMCIENTDFLYILTLKCIDSAGFLRDPVPNFTRLRRMSASGWSAASVSSGDSPVVAHDAVELRLKHRRQRHHPAYLPGQKSHSSLLFRHPMTRLSSTLSTWYQHIRPSRPVAAGGCIHRALIERARSEPDRILLIDGNGALSQGELVDAMSRRAAHLLAACGKSEATVAVSLTPGIDTVVTYFACLKAGLRYLPLAQQSAAVLQRLLVSLAPDLLVTADTAWLPPSGVPVYALTAETGGSWSALPGDDPHRIAHCLPTSGTETGTPKTVLTDHVGSMLSHAFRTRVWGYAAGEVVGCNIFGIWDVVPALCNGVPVVMIDDRTIRDPRALAASIVQYGITRLMLTPTLLDACLATDESVAALARLRRIVLCGEVVSANLIAKAGEQLPDTKIGNLYSLSECHDVAAIDLIVGEQPAAGHIADFAEVHITDPQDPDRLVPVGQPGRVFIGGQALARGYVDARLTAEKFRLLQCFEDGVPRLAYDSGDLGSLDETGRLFITGRAGGPVKIRGAWADPDAVARVLKAHPEAARATVVSREAGGRSRLSAFVVPAGTAHDGMASSLRQWLRDRLQAQSLPADITLVGDLPLTPAGKVDHRQLLDALPAAGNARGGNDPASIVLATFRDVLERGDAGPDDSFESLGGDSLSAVILCSELHRRTGKRVHLDDLWQYPSAAGLAALLAGRAERARVGLKTLPSLDADITVRPPRSGVRQVLVTGATGALGSSLVDRLLTETEIEVSVLVRARDTAEAMKRLAAALADANHPRLHILVGDLGSADLGLDASVLDRLVAEIDVIVHAGADMNMFATYASLERVNVGGTHALLRLAARAGARVCHISSSAVLPLDPGPRWDESRFGLAFAKSLVAPLRHADGYSQSKLAAEALVWQAFDRGLGVSVLRLPHLIGGRSATRLGNTLGLLAELNLLPEGQWGWQVASVQMVCDRLLASLAAAAAGRADKPLIHIAPALVDNTHVTGAMRQLGRAPRMLPLPALVSRLRHHRPGEAQLARLASLNQLIAEFGPAAALSLADARLVSSEPVNTDPAGVAAALLEPA